MASVNCSRGECFPDDCLADVGGDKQGDSRAKTISFLKQLIQEKDNETSNKELDDDEETHTSSNITGVSVHTSQHIHNSLANSDHHSKELLSSTEQGSVLRSISHFNQLGTSQQLHDQARGDDGGDTQLHQGSAHT